MVDGVELPGAEDGGDVPKLSEGMAVVGMGSLIAEKIQESSAS